MFTLLAVFAVLALFFFLWDRGITIRGTCSSNDKFIGCFGSLARAGFSIANGPFFSCRCN